MKFKEQSFTLFADFCSSLNYTHNCCKCLAVSCGNISANVRYLNSTKQFELDAVALFLSGYPYLLTLSLLSQLSVRQLLDKQIFRGVLSLLNAKEKRPKLQCLRRFLSLVGEDGFEPSKRNATDLQSAPFGHSGILPYQVFQKSKPTA